MRSDASPRREAPPDARLHSFWLMNPCGNRRASVLRGRLKIEAAPAIASGIIELAVARHAPVIHRGPHLDRGPLRGLRDHVLLRALQRIERNDRIHVMCQMLHHTMKEPIDEFGESDMHGAA